MINPQNDLYTYTATNATAIDGDTIEANIDLGFQVTLAKSTIRLARINAPEMRGRTRAEGQAAKEALEKLVKDAILVIKTKRDRTGKYGRYIAEVFRTDTKEPTNLNDLLVLRGFAKYQRF